MIASQATPLHLLIDGEPRRSAASEYSNVYDPSTGSVIAQAPMCTADEVDAAVQSCAGAVLVNDHRRYEYSLGSELQWRLASPDLGV